jgi:DNA-binding NarL/FixJ family response regulator
MRNNSAIIATTADFLASILRDKLITMGIQLIDIALSDNDLANKIERVKYRLVFMENCFHGHGTEEYVLRLTKHTRGLRIIIWSAAALSPIIAYRFIIAGADSYFSLRDTKDNLTTILRRIAAGQKYFPDDVAKIFEKRTYMPLIGAKITVREIEIIKLSIDGKTIKQIAIIMGVTVRTVKFHKTNLYRKCGGNTTIYLLRYGLTRGIICPEDLMLGEGGV